MGLLQCYTLEEAVNAVKTNKIDSTWILASHSKSTIQTIFTGCEDKLIENQRLGFQFTKEPKYYQGPAIIIKMNYSYHRTLAINMMQSQYPLIHFTFLILNEYHFMQF